MATDSGSSVFDSLVEDHTALMQTLSKKLTLISSKGEGASIRGAREKCISFVSFRSLDGRPSGLSSVQSQPVPLPVMFKQL